MGQNEDSVEQETPKREGENRRWKYAECNNGIRDRGLKQRLQGGKQTKDPTTNGIEGGAKESEHIMEFEEYKKDIHMRFSVRRSWNM
jgi:hypothetical protein